MFCEKEFLVISESLLFCSFQLYNPFLFFIISTNVIFSLVDMNN